MMIANLLVAVLVASTLESPPEETVPVAEPTPAPVAVPEPAPAPVAEPTPAPAPAPAPVPAPAPAPVAWTPAPAPAPAPVPEPNGVGLLVAGPITTALGIPLSFLGNAAWRDNCGPTSSDRECTDGSLASGGSHALAGIAFATGITLTAIGGGRFGRHQGLRDPSRNAGGFIAGGAVLLPGALIGMGMVRLFLWLSTPECQTYACVAGRQTTSSAVVGGLAVAASAGAGMFTYGLGYNRARPRTPPLTLSPSFGRTHAGLSLRGRF